MIVGVLGDLGEPDHFLGVDGLAVDDSGHLAVAAAGVEAHPAARQMAADSLGGARLLGDLVAEDHLEGALVHAGHEVGVKGTGAAGGEGLFQIAVNVLVPADIHLEAALHPQHGLDQAVDVVLVGLAHLRGAVDEGVTHCHLAAGALQGNGDRLLRRLKKRAVELQDGHELRVQAGLVFDLKLDTVLIHDKSPPKIFGSPSFWLLRFPSFGDIMRSRKRGLEQDAQSRGEIFQRSCIIVSCREWIVT